MTKALSVFAILFFISSAHATTEDAVECHYAYMGMPFASVAIFRDGSGGWQTQARVTQTGGAQHFESFTTVAAASGETVHGWISLETDQNKLEMIVYDAPTEQGRSKLINPNIPFANVMWGECDGL